VGLVLMKLANPATADSGTELVILAIKELEGNESISIGCGGGSQGQLAAFMPKVEGIGEGRMKRCLHLRRVRRIGRVNGRPGSRKKNSRNLIVL